MPVVLRGEGVIAKNSSVGVGLMVLAVSGCDAPPQGEGRSVIAGFSGPDIVRVLNAEQVALGKQVYDGHCARCHGDSGQGDPAWRQPGADGLYPPPPLDGSGHSWHHSTAWLKDMIRNGSPPGKGNMPAWGDTLSDEEIDAVIAWFQSRWPDPVYAAWYENQHRGRGGVQ